MKLALKVLKEYYDVPHDHEAATGAASGIIGSLDKAVSEATSDRAGVQAELDAVMDYLGKLKEICIEKAEPYAEAKARREAELAGLKEALEILEGEAVLLQQAAQRRLRGRVLPHSVA